MTSSENDSQEWQHQGTQINSCSHHVWVHGRGSPSGPLFDNFARFIVCLCEPLLNTRDLFWYLKCHTTTCTVNHKSALFFTSFFVKLYPCYDKSINIVSYCVDFLLISHCIHTNDILIQHAVVFGALCWTGRQWEMDKSSRVT